ncbi:hypothetical protein DFH09DRAFT_1204820 [Mycena vulgaris]|nr:hypothetical protein DFH09DRAFT_1204820 [Mycena vulgaris]
MHPALQIETLQRLPISVRRVALAACGPSPSPWAVERARLLIIDLPWAQQLLFLPVFFLNLDPSGVPTSEEVEPMHLDTRRRIANATLSLDGIIRIGDKPLDIGPHLWRRLWPWIEFAYTYWDQLPEHEDFHDLSFYQGFLLFGETFYRDPSTAALMGTTPGVQAFLAKTWTFLPKLADSPFIDMMLTGLCGYLLECRASNSSILADLVEGAGGTFADLADLVMKYFEIVLQRASMLSSDSKRYYIGTILAFIDQTNVVVSGEDENGFAPHGALLRTLLQLDFVEMLISAMAALSQTSGDNTGPALRGCLTGLRRIFGSYRGHIHLEQAIECGLLRVIVACATLDCEPEFDSDLHTLFTETLLAGLLDYYLVSRVRDSFIEHEHLYMSEVFERSPIFRVWRVFYIRAQERIQIMDRLESPEYTASKACDNNKCGEIHDKSEFLRCNGCKSAYYCSPDCQSVDWKDGGHRKLCRSPVSLRLSEIAIDGPSFHEREFLRAVIHHDYEDLRLTISRQQARFMADHTTDEPFFTVFSYASTPPKISVHSATNSPFAVAVKAAAETEWSESLAHTVASGGRTQLHRMEVGGDRRFWLIPLRTNEPEFHGELRRLALEISDDVVVDAQIQVLLAAHPNLKEIH